MSYLVRRAIHACVLLAGVSALTFLLLQLAPGDYFSGLQANPQIAPQTVAALREHYGLTRSFPVRYWRWIEGVFHGDLGVSFAYSTPVAPLLLVRARNTLLLASAAMALTWLLALPLGVWAAARKGKLLDRALGVATSGLLIIPDLMVALVLLLLAVRTGAFPAGGMFSVHFADLGWTQKLRDIAMHLFLPLMALVLTSLPIVLRHVRAAMVEVLDAPFIRTARAHGIPPMRMMFRHALPAAANPLLTLLGFSFAALLSGSMLVEVVLSWPGLGPLLLEAVLSRDVYLVVGGVMLSTVFLLVGNFLADALLYWCDPRIRAD